MPTAKEIKAKFEQTLAGRYSKRVAESLFFVFLDQAAQLSKTDYLLDSELALSGSSLESLLFGLKRLNEGEPYQHVLGKVEFYGLRLEVNSSVLIPRPETEELIDLIAQSGEEPKSILDIGTGSGCIALAMKKLFPEADITAIDTSDEALEIAKGNTRFNDLNVHFRKVNFLSEAHKLAKNFDLIVSNPPYIALSEKNSMSKVVLDYEPHLALFTKKDPLIFYKAIRDFSVSWLKSGGAVYLEVNAMFAEETATIFDKGFEVVVIKDLSGNKRFVKAIKKASEVNSEA